MVSVLSYFIAKRIPRSAFIIKRSKFLKCARTLCDKFHRQTRINAGFCLKQETIINFRWSGLELWFYDKIDLREALFNRGLMVLGLKSDP